MRCRERLDEYSVNAIGIASTNGIGTKKTITFKSKEWISLRGKSTSFICERNDATTAIIERRINGGDVDSFRFGFRWVFLPLTLIGVFVVIVASSFFAQMIPRTVGAVLMKNPSKIKTNFRASNTTMFYRYPSVFFLLFNHGPLCCSEGGRRRQPLQR